jgi:acetyltransferase-like isoleucine patch superfamily enzyme/acyl carrier protein
MSTLYLCGAGNPEGVRLALRVNNARQLWHWVQLLDDDSARHGELHLGIHVAGAFDTLRHAGVGAEAVNLVARTTAGRMAAAERIASFGVPITGLVGADVDLLGTHVSADLIAYPNATIGPEASIDVGCVVFMGAVVGHECTVGRYCVIAANAVLNARVQLGDGVYIGSSAVVLPEIVVGAGATIGAGATVVDDVPAGATVLSPRADLVRMNRTAQPTQREVRPAAEIEEAITVIWCEALGHERVDIDANFFDLGGTSLLALRMLNKLEATLGATLSPVELFDLPTIRSLAARLSAQSTGMRSMDPGRLRAERRRQVLSGT